MPLPTLKNAVQCSAKSKRSGVRCLNQAAYGCKTCRFHGARKRDTIRTGPSHWNWQHGRCTTQAKAVTAEEIQTLKMLKALIKKWDL